MHQTLRSPKPMQMLSQDWTGGQTRGSILHPQVHLVMGLVSTISILRLSYLSD